LERSLLVVSSDGGENGGTGVMVEVGHSGVQTQEFLRSFPPLESLLTSLLSPCGTVRLFDHVVTSGRRDHLPVVDIDQTWDLSNRGSVAAELIGMDDLWNIIFTQQAG